MPQPTLSRRAFGAGLASVLAIGPMQASAAALSLAEISRYLTSLGSSRSTFTQINADGSRSTGTLSIKRPGRMRLEYDPPEQALVLASGGQVAIFDRKVRGKAESYPLRRTPLKYLLRNNVNLGAAGIVTRHVSDGRTTMVSARDPDNPELGSIDLMFSDNPISLRQWVLRTDQGETTIVLDGLQTVANLPNVQFSIQNQLRDPGN